jgi:glucose/arabinose dehydrogenase
LDCIDICTACAGLCTAKSEYTGNAPSFVRHGLLYITDNAYDERGTRPIAHAKDNIFQVKQGAWYGWPDYSSGIPVTDPQFRSERGPKPRFLMKEHPPVEKPWLTRPENAGVAKFDYSTNDSFGFKGQIFLAEFGS